MMEFLPYIVGQITQLFNLVLMLGATVIGLIFGAIPGLSGTLAVMLFMPLTYTMNASRAMVFLIALWAGGCSRVFIGSVFLGIPGSASAVATCFDGYPMVQIGRAGEALAIGMMASFLGTFFNTILGALLSQKIADIAFALGPWEHFSLCFVAITIVLAISKGNMFKGLASASADLLFTSVGYSPIDAEPRFVFNNMYLMSGLGMTIILTGIFGAARIMEEYGKGFGALPDVDTKSIKGLGITLKEIKAQFVSIVRSFGVGLGIGLLPGMESGLPNLAAYSSARNGSRTPEMLGKGCPDGIRASEVSNSAVIGGSMIPMAALGIPGDSITALLVGVFMIHGLEMGPMVFKNSGGVVYLMFATVMVCAVLILIPQALGMRVFPLIPKVPYRYMYPALIIISFVSAYMDSGSLYKCGMMLVLVVISLMMSYGGLPTAPLILAFILGPTLESNILKAFQHSGSATAFFTRPISCVLMLIRIGYVFSPIFCALPMKTKNNKQKETNQMPLNSTSAMSFPSQKLMERCCRTPWVSYLPPFQMVPGVYYVSGNDWVTCYLTNTGIGLILIDTAMHETRCLMSEYIRSLGYDPMDIKKILLTHAYVDHIGAARTMKGLTGARVYLGGKDLFMVHERKDLICSDRCTCGDIEPDEIYLDDRLIVQGNVSVRTISTPRHTPGCTSMIFDVKEKDDRIYTCGIHSGVGLGTLSRELLEQNGLPPSLQEEFCESPRMMNRLHVDICLPSHTDQVGVIPLIGEITDTHNPFVDESIWHELIHECLDRIEALIRSAPLL